MAGLRFYAAPTHIATFYFVFHWSKMTSFCLLTTFLCSYWSKMTSFYTLTTFSCSYWSKMTSFCTLTTFSCSYWSKMTSFCPRLRLFLIPTIRNSQTIIAIFRKPPETEFNFFYFYCLFLLIIKTKDLLPVCRNKIRFPLNRFGLSFISVSIPLTAFTV